MGHINDALLLTDTYAGRLVILRSTIDWQDMFSFLVHPNKNSHCIWKTHCIHNYTNTQSLFHFLVFLGCRNFLLKGKSNEIRKRMVTAVVSSITAITVIYIGSNTSIVCTKQHHIKGALLTTLIVLYKKFGHGRRFCSRVLFLPCTSKPNERYEHQMETHSQQPKQATRGSHKRGKVNGRTHLKPKQATNNNSKQERASEIFSACQIHLRQFLCQYNAIV